ncbi:DEKNAAC103933 [Brettanomyces naardenensis]|uniref:Protein-lysine N-methyltransferase EFM5 n=1 Tax=Brettanomyces naardenensis TaxID=13370 RepID=A0A448YPP5_BRENA|nr:DEKNAAC103933 [Brettanomyces naardenensis]
MTDSDDDMPVLSADTLAALQEFQDEEKGRLEKFSKMYQSAENEFDERKEDTAGKEAVKLTIDDFKEDWQLSQFWYSDKTANILADALLEGADQDTVICIVSAPSVYAMIKARDASSLPTERIYLFEYDRRFELLSGSDHFGFYDYNEPLKFRDDLKGKVNRLLIDPPFLEPECQEKSSRTAGALLSKDRGKTRSGVDKYRLISCTGERMKDQVRKNYPDTRISTFYPEHKNGLSNEFRCYASFECRYWGLEKDSARQ